MRRELQVVASGAVVGAVSLDGGRARFEGKAADVFAAMRARTDDVVLARRLINDGWSNGYLMLAEA